MNSSTDLERLFKAGITAYQDGEYGRAIASLSKLLSCESSTYRIKASMGLVRVYMAQKDWERAKTLCEKVGTSAKPALQEWSQKTLTKIARYSAAALDAPGIQPDKLASARSGSGFQPLEVASDTPRVSMFHYAYLNGEESGEPATSEPAASSLRVADSLAATRKPVPGDPVANCKPVTVPAESVALVSEASPRQVQDSERAADETLGWIYAGRLSQGKSLGKIKRGQLWLVQIGGVIAFYFLWRTLIGKTLATLSSGLSYVAGRIRPLEWLILPDLWQAMTWALVAVMGLSVIAAPWLWDLWLRLTAPREPLSASTLRGHSAEAVKIINDYCRRRRWPFPKLWQLSTDVPLIFSYGWLPRNARIVVSRGLLSQLKEDELAALVAYEMSHWQSWHWRLLSAQGLFLQLLLWLYWQCAQWGNRQVFGLKYLAGVVATTSYGLFWLSRLAVLGMSRVRTYFSDRAATVTTGNPNGLTRALAKLSFALAASIEQQGYTPILIEGLTPLLPVGADLARAHLYNQLPLSQLFAWDSQNPLRAWMSCVDTHPPLGDRIRLLMAYAQYWQLTPEIQLTHVKRKRKGLSGKQWRQIAQQSTPYVGLAIGLCIGIVLLTVGAIAAALIPPPVSDPMVLAVTQPKPPSVVLVLLDWMHRDRALFQSCWLLGTGIGIILRINRFFPDLSFSTPLVQDTAHWLSDPSLLPADSPPAKLSGQLVGRPGVANWLGQDLLLKTQVGLLKLHYFSLLGPLGNVWNRPKTPLAVASEPVQVLGWFRRGNRPWIDIDQIRTANGSLIRAAHPVYSLLVAAMSIGWALWLLIH